MGSISADSLNDAILNFRRGDGVGGNVIPDVFVIFEPKPLVVDIVDVNPCCGESVNFNGRSSGTVLNEGRAGLYMGKKVPRGD